MDGTRGREHDVAVPEPRPDPDAPFRCEVTYVDDDAVVLPRGDIDLVTAPLMLRDARATLALPVNRIVIDLRHVTFMDSSGLNALNTARREAADHGTELTLSSVPPQPRTVMEITGLAESFGLQTRSSGAPPTAPGGTTAEAKPAKTSGT